jgi:hypothetical protein
MNIGIASLIATLILLLVALVWVFNTPSLGHCAEQTR